MDLEPELLLEDELFLAEDVLDFEVELADLEEELTELEDLEDLELDLEDEADSEVDFGTDLLRLEELTGSDFFVDEASRDERYERLFLELARRSGSFTEAFLA